MNEAKDCENLSLSKSLQIARKAARDANMAKEKAEKAKEEAEKELAIFGFHTAKTANDRGKQYEEENNSGCNPASTFSYQNAYPSPVKKVVVSNTSPTDSKSNETKGKLYRRSEFVDIFV